MRRLGGVAGTLAVALAMAACGSSSLSTVQLRTSAAQACDLAHQRAEKIPTPSTPAGGAGFLSRGITALAPAQATLESLRPPGDLAGAYRTAVGFSGKRLAALRFTLADLKVGDDPVVAIKSLQEKLAPLEARGDAAWRSLGIPACADI